MEDGNQISALLSEFFSAQVNAQRRKEIEAILLSFRRRHDAWQICHRLLVGPEASNPLVSFYCASVFEVCRSCASGSAEPALRTISLSRKETITWYWSSLEASTRRDIREFLFQFVASAQDNISGLSRLKWLKILADLGKHDWPHEYPDYFNHVETLLTNPRCFDLIKLIIEEFCDDNDDLSPQRQQQLKSLLAQQVPLLLHWVSSACNLLGDRALEALQALHTYYPVELENAMNESLSDAIFTQARHSAYAVQMCTRILEASQSTQKPLFARKTVGIIQAASGDCDVEYGAALDDCARAGLRMQFPHTVNDICSAYLAFTQAQTTPERFLRCIDVWGDFLSALAEQGPPGHVRYQRHCLSLLETILIRVRHNSPGFLCDMDAESRQEFVHECAAVISQASDLYPDHVVPAVEQMFSELAAQYMQMHTTVADASGLQAPNVRALARDTASAAAMCGAVAACFTINFVGTMEYGIRVVQKLLDVCTYGQNSQLYTIGLEFADVQAETIGALVAYADWIHQLDQQPDRQADFNGLVSYIVSLAGPLLANSKLPAELQGAGARLLQSLAVTVRPPQLLTLPPMPDLIRDPTQALEALPLDVQEIVFSVLTAACVLPWHNNKAQQWEEREAAYKSIMLTFVARFLSSAESVLDPLSFDMTSIERLGRQLRIVKACVALGAGAPKQGRLVLHDGLAEVLLKTPRLMSNPDLAADVLDVLVTVIQVLRAQVGMEYIEQSLRMVLAHMSADHAPLSKAALSKHVTKLATSTYELAEISLFFLELANYIADDRGALSRLLMGDVITVCVEHVWPTLQRADGEYSEAICQYCRVLASVILNHHKSQGEKLPGLLQVLFAAVNATDLDIFRTALSSLNTLHEKVRIYAHPSMVPFSPALVARLMDVLVARTHMVAEEDTLLALYQLRECNRDSFVNAHMVEYIMRLEIDAEQKHAIMTSLPGLPDDMPSFNAGLLRMASGIRFAQKRRSL